MAPLDWVAAAQGVGVCQKSAWAGRRAAASVGRGRGSSEATVDRAAPEARPRPHHLSASISARLIFSLPVASISSARLPRTTVT